MRILAALLLLLALLSAVAVTIHQRTSAVAAGDDWPTYMHDIQRSSTSNDTTISTSNAGQLVNTLDIQDRWRYWLFLNRGCWDRLCRLLGWL